MPESELSVMSNLTAWPGRQGISMDGWVDNKNEKSYLSVTYLGEEYTRLHRRRHEGNRSETLRQ